MEEYQEQLWQAMQDKTDIFLDLDKKYADKLERIFHFSDIQEGVKTKYRPVFLDDIGMDNLIELKRMGAEVDDARADMQLAQKNFMDSQL